VFKEFTKALESRPKFLWFVIFLYMSFIFYLSSISYPPQVAKGVKHAPIFEHILEFGILGFLLFLGFRSLNSLKFYKNAATFAVLFGTIYGILDEVHQYFVPGRYSELIDVIANFIGVVFAVLITKIKLK